MGQRDLFDPSFSFNASWIKLLHSDPPSRGRPGERRTRKIHIGQFTHKCPREIEGAALQKNVRAGGAIATMVKVGGKGVNEKRVNEGGGCAGKHIDANRNRNSEDKGATRERD